MSVDIGLNIKGNSRDAQGALASVSGGLVFLDKQIKVVNRDLKSLDVGLKQAQRNFRSLDRDITRSSHAVRALSLDFFELRNAIRNMASRSAITGMASIAGAITSIAGAATTAAAAVGNLGAALAVAGGAGLAAGISSVVVSALALDGVMKALTTTGKDHEKALDDLTLTARAFAKEMRPVLDLYRELKLLSQEGIFPGLTRGLKNVLPMFEMLKQTVYDTAVNMGYLAERASVMFVKRSELVKKVLESNNVLIQKYGRATTNIGAGFLENWVAAIPMIKYVATRVEVFSKKFKDNMREWREDGSLANFFDELKDSFYNWERIATRGAKIVFGIWKAAQPAVHRMERDLAKLFGNWNEWVDKNGARIGGFFTAMYGPFKAFSRFMGESIALIARLGIETNGTVTRLFDGLTSKFLPVVEELALMLHRDFVQNIADALGSMLDFIAVVLPSLELILKPLGYIATGFATILDTMKELVQWSTTKFGAAGGLIATALSVATVTATWIALRTQIGLVLGMLGKGGSLVRRASAAPAAMIAQTVSQQARMGATGVYAYSRARTQPGAPLAGRPLARSLEQARMYPSQHWVSQRYPAPQVQTYAPRSPLVSSFIAPRAPTREERGYQRVVSGGQSMYVRGLRDTPVRQSNPNPRGTRIERPVSTPVIPMAFRNQYSKTLANDTHKGFLGGLKSMKGAAGVGAIMASLGVSMGLAIAVPAGIALFGYLKKKADAKPKEQRELGNISQNLALANLTGKTPLTLNRGRVVRSDGDGGTMPISDPHVDKLAKDLGKAIKAGDPQKIRAIRDELAALAGTLKDVGQQNVLKDFATDLNTVAAQASVALLGKLEPDFQTFAAASKQSVGNVMDALNVLKTQIAVKLPVGSQEYKTAMASAFGEAARAVQASVDAQVVDAEQGARKITQLVYKQFRSLGFSVSESKNLANPNNKSNDAQNKQGGNENPGGRGKVNYAKGGYVVKKGLAGMDSVPMQVDGQKIVTAPGEYVGVFTRHQQQDFEQASGVGMSEFFERNKRPHYFAKGGIVQLGRRIQRMEYEGAPYHVSEHPAFGGVQGRHAPNGYHYKAGALDVNHDVPPGSEMGALDKLNSMLRSEGWRTLWRVADHFDHLHVDIGNGGTAGLPSGMGAVEKIKRVMANGTGLFGGLVQGGLDRLRDGANKKLEEVAGTMGFGPGMEDLGDGAVKGKGGSAANQRIARAMMDQFGWAANMWPAWQRLGVKESNWNENAVNPSSGAFGIGQFLGATRTAYAKYGASSTEPRQQIYAMAKYIKDRYGDPEKALAFHNANNWYYAGGMVENGRALPPWTEKRRRYMEDMLDSYTDQYGNPIDHHPIPAKRWTGKKDVDIRNLPSEEWNGGAKLAQVTPPDPNGNKRPPINPDDAVTPGSVEKKKKKKAKKKKVVRVGPKPTGGGVGTGAFKPKSKKPKPKARQRVKNLIEKQFRHNFGMTDPITGEPIGIEQYMPLALIGQLENQFSDLSSGLENVTSRHGLTEEQAIVNLYDSNAFPDLTNYLKSIGQNPVEWMEENGDSLEVVNSYGMNVQGVYTRGISHAVAELMEQLTYIEGGSGQPFGMIDRLQHQLSTATGIPSKAAIEERVNRLAQVKKIFEANVALRKSYRKKMNKMGNKNYTWQEAVQHNQDLIDKWTRWKRDSINEPQADTDTANKELDRLRDLNKDLRRKKPKGTIYGSGEYNRTLGIYQGRGVENRMLVGDKDATTWRPSVAGGYAGDVWGSIQQWRDIDDQRTGVLSDTPGRITSTKFNADTLRTAISDWTGTRVPPAPINRDTSAEDSRKAQMTELDKIISMDKLRNSLLGVTQFGVLENFANILGMRMLGQYAHGGLVPETGLAMVHKGEFINPAPDGPYRNGMNAAPGYGGNNFAVEVILKDKAGALVEFVDARVRKIAPAEVSRQTGRNTRRISAAPGGRI